MTHTIYTHQQLHLKSLARLKQIYSEIGASVEVRDRRCKDAWISAFVEDVGAAIAQYQASKLQKINEQDIAQAEFDQYIEDQAQSIAPEELTAREISFYHHEYYALGKLIAAIDYDNDLTQPWVVTINNAKEFRAATPMMCDRYIRIHYKDGSEQFATRNGLRPASLTQFAIDKSSLDKGLRDLALFPDFREFISLPVQEPETPTSTGNEVMVQIAAECDKYGLELLDKGIYTNDGVKLGSVGCIPNKLQYHINNCELRIALVV
ncbi:hypothetical protein [Nostoc sp. CCY 9925]|uniref:hypothetical protein n=1 Tax=Nostoc sp. CCY 9925 TaxID=3103865 RepID=UPI0039C61050